MFFKKSQPFSFSQEVVIGDVAPPRREEYLRIRSDSEIHSSILSIIDYRISNAYRQLSIDGVTDQQLRSAH
jgi:hypothetical protein